MSGPLYCEKQKLLLCGSNVAVAQRSSVDGYLLTRLYGLSKSFRVRVWQMCSGRVGAIHRREKEANLAKNPPVQKLSIGDAGPDVSESTIWIKSQSNVQNQVLSLFRQS